MDQGRRQHLQDIYATDHTAQTSRDDFTPQVSTEFMEQRNRDRRRHELAGFLLGATLIGLTVVIIYVVVKKYIDITKETEAPTPITQEYIPRYSLPVQAQWVLDLSRDYGDPKWDGEGERPLNSTWVKKAAFNLILAEQAIEVGRYDEDKYADAAKYLENTLEIIPEIKGVRPVLGMLYFRMDKFDNALAILKNVPESELTYDMLNNLGAACIQAKAYDQAESYLRRALELKPTYPEALKNMALLYKQQDRKQEAIAAMEQYLDQRPTDTDTRYDFALYLTKIGNWELAGEQLRTLTREVTDVANLYVLLARVETKLGNDKAAIEAFRRASQLTDPKQALFWMDDSEFDRLRDNDDFQALMKYNQK